MVQEAGSPEGLHAALGRPKNVMWVGAAHHSTPSLHEPSLAGSDAEPSDS